MKVTIEGKEYDLDIEKAKALKLLTEVWKPVKLGDKFIIEGNTYVLACPKAGYIILIDINHGYRWIEQSPVNNIADISEQEFINYVGPGYKVVRA
jgi:hypothetical protein